MAHMGLFFKGLEDASEDFGQHLGMCIGTCVRARPSANCVGVSSRSVFTALGEAVLLFMLIRERISLLHLLLPCFFCLRHEISRAG